MSEALIILGVMAVLILFVVCIPVYFLAKSFTNKQNMLMKSKDASVIEEIKDAWKIIIKISEDANKVGGDLSIPHTDVVKVISCLEFLKNCTTNGYETGQTIEYYNNQIELFESFLKQGITIQTTVSSNVSVCELICVHIKNSDGISRQIRLGECESGDPVIIKPDPNDRNRGETALGVFARGYQIGNLSTGDCEWLYPMLEEGFIPNAAIICVEKNPKKNNKLECAIEIELPEED